MTSVRIATRASDLAMAQSRRVAAMIAPSAGIREISVRKADFTCSRSR